MTTTLHVSSGRLRPRADAERRSGYTFEQHADWRVSLPDGEHQQRTQPQPNRETLASATKPLRHLIGPDDGAVEAGPRSARRHYIADTDESEEPPGCTALNTIVTDRCERSRR
ncbi:MAG: hypothetical protein OXI26_11800 [bacterium]|nr:hypothetical protein [bacterium]